MLLLSVEELHLCYYIYYNSNEYLDFESTSCQIIPHRIEQNQPNQT